MSERTTFAVPTAGFWYTAARKYQAEGKMKEALMAMENAFNHTENALYSERKNHPASEQIADAATLAK